MGFQGLRHAQAFEQHALKCKERFGGLGDAPDISSDGRASSAGLHDLRHVEQGFAQVVGFRATRGDHRDRGAFNDAPKRSHVAGVSDLDDIGAGFDACARCPEDVFRIKYDFGCGPGIIARVNVGDDRQIELRRMKTLREYVIVVPWP